jgi:hypothetical protein
MARGDTNGIAGAISPALGCARGSVRHLRKIAEKRRLDALSRCPPTRSKPKSTPAVKRVSAGPTGRRTSRLQAERAALPRVGHRTGRALRPRRRVAASSGGANSLDHPAQRRFREAMFYTLIAQTGDI